MSAGEPLERVVVGVPACDEAASIAAAITAIDRAAACVGVPVDLVVVDDGSTDATASVAADAVVRAGALRTATVLSTACGTAGRARTLALDHGLAAIAGTDLSHVWLATTDGDTVVHDDWLRGQLRWAASGSDAVAGLVEVAWEPGQGELAARYEHAVARLGRGVGHPHVHGANLGVRASWWVAVGGCGRGDDGEDHELWQRLRRAGARVASVPDVRVTTSARVVGRAPGGFSGYLRTLAAEGAVGGANGTTLAPA